MSRKKAKPSVFTFFDYPTSIFNIKSANTSQTRNYNLREVSFTPEDREPGEVRTLADMSEDEILALEAQYGCKVKR